MDRKDEEKLVPFSSSRRDVRALSASPWLVKEDSGGGGEKESIID